MSLAQDGILVLLGCLPFLFCRKMGGKEKEINQSVEDKKNREEREKEKEGKKEKRDRVAHI